MEALKLIAFIIFFLATFMAGYLLYSTLNYHVKTTVGVIEEMPGNP